MTEKIRSIKLLSKTTFIYLIFTFIAFFISAAFLTHDANEFINEEIEQRFRYSEHRIKRYLKAGKDHSYLRKSNTKVILLTDIPDTNVYPLYSDTLIYNSDLEEMQHFRTKTIVFEANDNYYKLTITKGMEDFYRLRDNIFEALFPAFIILAVVIVLFNYLMSGYFFHPFNKILEQMRFYKVGERSAIKKVTTNTNEFIKMQQLFHNMVERIENDYRNLKEYTENMAHEIQTPLTVIRNKTENLIADDRLMVRHADSVKIIYDETNHLSKLGNTLNLITKIENREFNNAIQIFTLPVVEKHVEAIRELARLKSLTIETDLSEEHYMKIDPFLLDIIMKNLLRNAIRYGTIEGSVHITTTANSLSVSNYGPPLEVPFEKLVERFYRNNGTQTSLGLGLALVKKICELNNLRIDYQYKDKQHFISILVI